MGGAEAGERGSELVTVTLIIEFVMLCVGSCYSKEREGEVSVSKATVYCVLFVIAGMRGRWSMRDKLH